MVESYDPQPRALSSPKQANSQLPPTESIHCFSPHRSPRELGPSLARFLVHDRDRRAPLNYLVDLVATRNLVGQKSSAHQCPMPNQLAWPLRREVEISTKPTTTRLVSTVLGFHQVPIRQQIMGARHCIQMHCSFNMTA